MHGPLLGESPSCWAPRAGALGQRCVPRPRVARRDVLVVPLAWPWRVCRRLTWLRTELGGWGAAWLHTELGGWGAAWLAGARYQCAGSPRPAVALPQLWE